MCNSLSSKVTSDQMLCPKKRMLVIKCTTFSANHKSAKCHVVKEVSVDYIKLPNLTTVVDTNDQ